MNSDLARDVRGSNCMIKTYVSEDTKKFDSVFTKNEESLCGFNNDTRAWCPLKVGDEMAQYYYFNWAEKMKSFQCSRFSQNDPESGSVCHDYYTAMQDEDEDLFSYFKFEKTVLSDDSAQIWANVAYNEECVAETLTKDFWNGHYATFDSYEY